MSDGTSHNNLNGDNYIEKDALNVFTVSSDVYFQMSVVRTLQFFSHTSHVTPARRIRLDDVLLSFVRS
jgi:hypothetical protein